MSKAFRGEKDHSKGGVINHNIERTKKGLGDKSLTNLQATNEIIYAQLHYKITLQNAKAKMSAVPAK